MASRSLFNWRTVAARSLDEIEAAHAVIGGTGRGRRYATLQINYAYAVLLSSQFQKFCRDLHSEAVDHLAATIPSPLVSDILIDRLTEGRKLDTGNPNPGNLGSDFSRLKLQLWSEVIASDARNAGRRTLLEQLNRWRNAIAHLDFDPAQLGARATLQLKRVRKWRRACDSLASEFDIVLGQHLTTILGVNPW